MKSGSFTLSLLPLLTIATCAAFAETPSNFGDKVKVSVPLKAESFDLTEVRLLDSLFRDNMLRDKDYLLKLDADRLLHTFRLTAGLPSAVAPLGGWEEPKGELRGHTIGHYLSACALMYASTGDDKLKAKANYIVAELAKCQEAMPTQGYNRGYLSAYPESFFDRVDAAQKVWAPYYTLHKIMAGLLDTYVHCGNQQALDVLTRMADWLKFRVGRLSHEQMQRALQNEHGGMNEVLANLSAITGDPADLELAHAFNHEAVFEPLARGEDKLNGLHANTQIPKIIGAAREYELTGDKTYRNIAEFFWQRVALNRSYVIGGHSDHEHFYPIEESSRHLSPETAESCNTYNMLKLTRHLFEWEPSATTMDFYERALYNHILGSQDPDTGMFTYFMSLKPGHFKVYSLPLDSFWCCVGTGMENHAKYGDTIYFHNDDILWVNLFIPSELSWKDKGLTVRQETNFPQQDTTKLIIKCEKPTAMELRVRHPGWATSGVNATLNGKKVDVENAPGSYFRLDRKWNDGDKVEIQFPMTLRTESLPDDPNTIAILYGPIVLAGELGAEGLPNAAWLLKEQRDTNKISDPPAPVFVGSRADVVSHVKPSPGESLVFHTKDLAKPHDISLIPFYRMHHQRYSVYWKVLTEEEWNKNQQQHAGAISPHAVVAK